jgi:cobyrinic acid a,c-diamide synthase
LARAWRKQGLRVQAFKSGPDFLDPMILEVATGRPVYNLDFTMCGEQDAQMQLHRAAQDADVIIVEGVMGLYDGSPSSADIAVRFNLPVLLTIDAGGMAQTFGALANGLLSHYPKLIPAGVLANKVGSAGHGKLLHDSLPPHLNWFGALQKNEALSLPERHLGLFRASEISDLEQKIETAASALAADLPLPPMVTFSPSNTPAPAHLLADKVIAIARDEAFCFIYQANLDCLSDMGARLKFFSPLHDKALPAADAYWLPGGYPELHLNEISTNIGMKHALHAAFTAGKPILAECGGMMALSSSLNAEPCFDLLPGVSKIEERLQGLGSLKAAFANGELGAHTFHYGSFTTELPPIATAKTRFGKIENIYQHGSILASFLHFYFASNPVLAAQLFTAR